MWWLAFCISFKIKQAEDITPESLALFTIMEPPIGMFVMLLINPMIRSRTIRTRAIWYLGQIDPQQSHCATILDKNVKKMDVAISNFKIKP